MKKIFESKHINQKVNSYVHGNGKIVNGIDELIGFDGYVVVNFLDGNDLSEHCIKFDCYGVEDGGEFPTLTFGHKGIKDFLYGEPELEVLKLNSLIDDLSGWYNSQVETGRKDGSAIKELTVDKVGMIIDALLIKSLE